MKFTVDRFEGDIAIIELGNGKVIDCPKELLPPNTKEGSIITITVDETATKEKLKENTERLNRLFKD